MKLRLTEKTKNHVWKYLNTHNIANRGSVDGSKQNQFVGLVGELAVYNYLYGYTLDLFIKDDGFDGGWDISYNNLKIDVKTKERSVPARPEFACDVLESQIKYRADCYVFCNFIGDGESVEICGYITKKDFLKKAVYIGAMQSVSRSDGTSFINKAGVFSVLIKDLSNIGELKCGY